MHVPKPIQNLIEAFEKLPGIGPKTAQRLTYYLLHVPQLQLDELAAAASNLKKQTVICSVCKNVNEHNPCDICSDVQRDQSLVCVVEQPLDILALEKSGKYQGVYHVLHGAISPLNNIGPDELYIGGLLDRVRSDKIEELILATNPTMEGEATALYVAKAVKQLAGEKVKITRIAHGLPVGADLEYADEVTLEKAMEGRREY